LNPNQFECLRGSYFFNGSCYFVSNKKYNFAQNFEADFMIETAKSVGRKFIQYPQSIVSLSPKVQFLPELTYWKQAVNACMELNNDSSLVYFEYDNEYTFLINLLQELSFNEIKIKPEQNVIEPRQRFNYAQRRMNEEMKYFIGLTHNNSAWRWINGKNLSNDLFFNTSLNTIVHDSYRKCAYLNLRDDGNVKIELTNCNHDTLPYICKYGERFHSNLSKI
jgi:hypothetical protein